MPARRSATVVRGLVRAFLYSTLTKRPGPRVSPILSYLVRGLARAFLLSSYLIARCRVVVRSCRPLYLLTSFPTTLHTFIRPKSQPKKERPWGGRHHRTPKGETSKRGSQKKLPCSQAPLAPTSLPYCYIDLGRQGAPPSLPATQSTAALLTTSMVRHA